MALFRAKFACNLAISNPVFRWESCKSSVWKSVKNCSKLCSEARTHGWISQVARDREAKSLVHYVMEKLTLRIPFSLQYKYPLYPQNIESFQREFWEKNPREKQDWLIHNLYIVTLQISPLSPFLLLHLWEVH